ncbi:MAG: coenzyme F420-0:L-glutamate ligase [Chloroflexi bacterium]|nr:MAG: coenzyme F420-0:L-glutamate ligase [Chloroflexota bacterium]
MNESMTLFSVPGLPMIRPGDDLAQLIAEKIESAGQQLHSGDILVIAQKVVSKAEGRLVRLSAVTPGERALELAEITGKDPRIVQVILDDSHEVVRARRGLLIVEQKSGWVCAHGGMDRSNVQPVDGEEMVALLPENSDASAEGLRARLAELTGAQVAVLISDSHGRPWKFGTMGVCIGCAGIPPIWNQRGLYDLFGYELVASEECLVDELAGAAALLMGQSAEGRPVVVIRGYTPPNLPAAPATVIQRPKEFDAFR